MAPTTLKLKTGSAVQDAGTTSHGYVAVCCFPRNAEAAGAATFHIVENDKPSSFALARPLTGSQPVRIRYDPVVEDDCAPD